MINQILICFYSEIYKILGRVFCILSIILGRATPNNDLTFKTSQMEASTMTCIVYGIFYLVPGNIVKKTEGSKRLLGNFQS